MDSVFMDSLLGPFTKDNYSSYLFYTNFVVKRTGLISKSGSYVISGTDESGSAIYFISNFLLSIVIFAFKSVISFSKALSSGLFFNFSCFRLSFSILS